MAKNLFPLKMAMMKISASFPHGMDAPVVGLLYLSISKAHFTAWAFHSNWHCVGVYMLKGEALQATASKELAEGPYIPSRAGSKPANLRSTGHQLCQCPTTPHNLRKAYKKRIPIVNYWT